jgi:hypothetical protein
MLNTLVVFFSLCFWHQGMGKTYRHQGMGKTCRIKVWVKSVASTKVWVKLEQL